MEREVNNTNNLKITEGIQTKLFDLKIDPNKQSKTFNVSDRELLRVVKEEKKISYTFFSSS
jgi:putative NADH-flavin reductase